jgi:hypothetical protein
MALFTALATIYVILATIYVSLATIYVIIATIHVILATMHFIILPLTSVVLRPCRNPSQSLETKGHSCGCMRDDPCWQAYFNKGFGYSNTHAGVLVEYSFYRPPPPEACRAQTRGQAGRDMERHADRDGHEERAGGEVRKGRGGRQAMGTRNGNVPDPEEPGQGDVLDADEQGTIVIGQKERFLAFWLDGTPRGSAERLSALHRAFEIAAILNRTVVVPPWSHLPLLFEQEAELGRVTCALTWPRSVSVPSPGQNVTVHLVFAAGA